MTHIAGPYTALYDGQVVGQVEDGFELDYGQTVEDITSDLFRSRQDAVFQGIDMMLKMVLIEVTQVGAINLIWPWSLTYGRSDAVGRLMTTMTKPLVLTRCAGTTASPISLTFPRTVLGTDRVTSKYGSVLRKLPVTAFILPYPVSGGGVLIGCDGAEFLTTA